MIVCSCNVLSDGQVRDCLNAPDCPRTAAQVYQCLGCSPKCGRCARTIRAIVAAALGDDAASGAHVCATSCANACPLARAAEAPHAHPHDAAPSPMLTTALAEA